MALLELFFEHPLLTIGGCVVGWFIFRAILDAIDK